MADVKEKCGVIGVYGKNLDVSRLAFFGLFALQHRGQEGSGICVTDGENLHCKKGVGLVTQIYDEDDMSELKGHIAVGHNRYSTSRGASSDHAEVQPYVCSKENLILAHNGNLPSTKALEEFLNERGIETKGYNDSKLMHRAIEAYMDDGKNLPDAIETAYPLFTGAFSLVVTDKKVLVGVRDQFGMRPLSLGHVEDGYMFASESCALGTVGSKVHHEVGPGEMIIVSEKGVEQRQVVEPTPKFDIFEYVYFARPDSRFLGKSVYQVRYNSGWELGKEFPVEADMVIPVPETSTPSAIGYSKKTGIPLELALVKNRYINRTFIEPGQGNRAQKAKLKYNALSSVIRGKRVVLVDDSFVRGTTTKETVKLVYEAGAKEVHFLVASPQIKYPDFYGIDTPEQKDFIAVQKNLGEIKEFFNVTSIYHLSLEGLIHATGISKDKLSTSCFTGEYPIDIKERKEEVDFDI